MEVTLATWIVAVAGLVLIGLLCTYQVVAILRPRARWTVENVYGGDPKSTDPTAYFAFNQGFAWADPFAWLPLQLIASVGMLMGHELGFVFAVAASVPYIYTAIQFFIWDRDLGYRQNTIYYWVVIWGMWPVFGAIQGTYALARLV